MMPITPSSGYTYKHLLPPCLTVEPVSCGAFLFPALADGGFNRLLAFAFSRLPAGARLAGFFACRERSRMEVMA